MINQLIALVLLFFSPPHIKAPVTHYHGYTLNRIAIQNAKKFTVLIDNEGFGSITRGTGVLVDSMTVLTCAHVVAESNEEMWIIPFPGNDIIRGKVLRMDEGKDLALVQLDRPVQLAHYAVFQDYHYDGEPITIIGNILGRMKWFVSYGIISGENQRDLYTDGLIRGGNSGGPWINEAGEIVALSDWGLVEGTTSVGISGGISASTILEFKNSKGLMEILQMMLGGK